MQRSLVENIARGRRAIELARARGLDTDNWQQQLAQLEQRQLLAWAAELAEQDLILSEPVCYVEAPLRQVTTPRVSEYAARYLRTITLARQRVSDETGHWSTFTVDWWDECRLEAFGALSALRAALSQRQRTGRSRRV